MASVEKGRAGIVTVVSALFWMIVPDPIAASEGVIILNDSNFDELVQDGTGELPWFIEFYAPWCGHCKRLEPQYDLLPAMVEGKAHIAKVDVTAEKKIGEEFEIQGFPTLLLVSNNLMYNYEGDRSADAMAKWLDGAWKKSSGQRLPKNKVFIDRIKERVSEYVSSAGQVVRFMPSLLPVVFLIGMVFGIFFCAAFGCFFTAPAEPARKPSSSPKDQEKKPEEKKAD
jgi:protein disulfide-isomerase-like protein